MSHVSFKSLSVGTWTEGTAGGGGSVVSHRWSTLRAGDQHSQPTATTTFHYRQPETLGAFAAGHLGLTETPNQEAKNGYIPVQRRRDSSG